jgi:arabinogalactan endo-1,4-beta-galactosidase
VPYDIIGLSYYQWWHGTLDDLRNTIELLSVTFEKEIFIVEMLPSADLLGSYGR